MTPINHIYIHVPFCSGKCLYCAFHSEIYNTTLVEKYLNALENEIKTATNSSTILPKTIYIGGGTPSLLSAPQLKILCQIIQDNINLEQLAEWTLEGNPGTFTDDKIAVLKEYGINRISLGAQSMNDKILSNMARRHTAEQTIQTVHQLQAAGFKNIGLDLIACLPGVTPETWQHTLNEIINLNPQHISVYALSLDPGSKLYQMQNANINPHNLEPGCPHPNQRVSASATYAPIKQPPAPTPQNLSVPPLQEQAALTSAENKLDAAKYHHYEVSNYAKNGCQCRHNTAIWKGADYIGFGPAAASRVGLRRWTNPRSEVRGQKSEIRGRKLKVESPETDAVERFMFTFRLYKGINLATFADNHGQAAQKLLPYWIEQLAKLEKEGLVKQTLDPECSHREINKNKIWSLTTQGRNFADTVAERMLP